MSGTHLEVIACGPATGLQDRGRFGWQRYGVSSSGAMDSLALAAANALVGNPPGTAAVEFVLMGGRFRVAGGPARLAVAGADPTLAVDGTPGAPGRSLTLDDDQVLDVGAMRAGTFAYLAVAGGFAATPALGSLSLQARAGLGGIEGRGLRAGDRLPLCLAGAPAGPELVLPALPLDGDAPVRVVLGPQDDHFPPLSIATFLGATYRVGREADRMGYRLSGPPIPHGPQGFNIISDGIVAGSVQVPGSGEPIVLMADRQTTGGYPKIATVISADLRRLAQRRPGDPVRFEEVTIEEAQGIARARAAEIAGLPALTRPAIAGAGLASDVLLALNLAGAATDALADPLGP